MIQFPETASGEPLAVSATLFVTYRACPQQALGRLRGAYPADSVASFKGSLAHRVFARHLVSGPILDGDLPRICREEIGAPDGPLGGHDIDLDGSDAVGAARKGTDQVHG